MAVYVSLLRAIGPVTHAKMSMAALRDAAVAAGFADAATIGNTGNLLLSSDLSAAQVRRAVQEVVDGFGIRSEVFVRTARQLALLVNANPLPDAASRHPAALGVCFFHQTPDWPDWVHDHDGPEGLATFGAHLLVDYRGKLIGGLPVERRIGAPMTQRNWTVTVRLAQRARDFARGRA